MDIRSQLLAAIEASGLNDRQLSIRATGGPDAVRNLRRGSIPRADNLERLCHAMGLQLQVVPAPGALKDQGSVPAQVGLTAFTGGRELPVHDWLESSEEGSVRRGEVLTSAPAPPEVSDQQAFYVRMPDHSMVPAEIRKDDYCLVSPLARIEVDRRVWFRKRSGREVIKWLLRLASDGFHLGSWDRGEERCAAPAASFLKREDVVERGVVVASYREQTALSKTLEPHAGWRPGPLADLWRLAEFSVSFKPQADMVARVLSSVDRLERDVKLVLARGGISDLESRTLLRALDFIIHERRESPAGGSVPIAGEGSRS